MSDLQQAHEYLRSFEADGLCEVIGVDSFGDKITVASCDPDFLLIVGAYVEMTWGITLAHSGRVAG